MRRFLQNCKRTLQVAKKPEKDEYFQVTKITGLGILLIGFVGFIIMFISTILQKGI
ncbi:MAG: protein translocase SEC61 complex subunit gamma [Hadesarchaea archaeon]|nr:MAG: protein translocase SEC61 complex subunit gamma [Hadesarchaea archaeon]HDI13146.1 protein translocase SEC61 complex subunit gamma [Hadesarchaea archaeon]